MLIRPSTLLGILLNSTATRLPPTPFRMSALGFTVISQGRTTSPAAVSALGLTIIRRF